MSDKQNDKEIKLDANSELRFAVEERSPKVFLVLVSGLAEIFGSELLQNKCYKFQTGANVAVFTYQGCVLQVTGKPKNWYVSKATPMAHYSDCHAELNLLRKTALEKDERGPIAMVVGPKDVGKSTLCSILLNYAARMGERPLFADIDVGQGNITIPGAMASMPIERPASVEEGFSQTDPVVLHFGGTGPGCNNMLYKQLVAKLAERSLEALRVNKRTKHSGIIINTCGWVMGAGYKHLLNTARSFEVNIIIVLDQERLYKQLLRDMPPSVKVVKLPKSGGVVNRSKSVRNSGRTRRLREYFHVERTPLYPFSFEVKFKDLKLYKIDAPPLPGFGMPIGMKGEDNKTNLVSVTPSPKLLHHILAVSFAESIEDDVQGSKVVGFICVTHVDVERQVVLVLSPHPRLLPNGILLLSELQYRV